MVLSIVLVTIALLVKTYILGEMAECIDLMNERINLLDERIDILQELISLREEGKQVKE